MQFFFFTNTGYNTLEFSTCGTVQPKPHEQNIKYKQGFLAETYNLNDMYI
uniref:Uncharacterized protein n=1 Tax=Anguilla anguilla TaxID=7936 RepID=A0A0E9QTM1_ANGAN